MEEIYNMNNLNLLDIYNLISNCNKKYIKIKQILNDKYFIYVLFINRYYVDSNGHIVLESNQIAVSECIDDCITSANIYTKSPICRDCLNIVIIREKYEYTIQELTRTEYDDELFKRLNANVRYEYKYK